MLHLSVLCVAVFAVVEGRGVASTTGGLLGDARAIAEGTLPGARLYEYDGVYPELGEGLA